jgi:hypothetical protein
MLSPQHELQEIIVLEWILFFKKSEGADSEKKGIRSTLQSYFRLLFMRSISLRVVANVHEVVEVNRVIFRELRRCQHAGAPQELERVARYMWQSNEGPVQ